ncbi:hypothetical protein [Bradyrhizobium lupini]|uniref:hypothetical protein n=1 Tax=Rhizobium lupini TaxID=136996 RepID=UPI0034C63AB0
MAWTSLATVFSTQNLATVRTAALEGGPHGLTVNAVAPVWMDTALMRGQLDAQAKNRGMSS